MVNAVKVDKLAHREVAIKYNVSVGLVSRLIVVDRKDPAFMQRITEREMKRRQKMRAVIDHALRKLNESATRFRAADV